MSLDGPIQELVRRALAEPRDTGALAIVLAALDRLGVELLPKPLPGQALLFYETRPIGEPATLARIVRLLEPERCETIPVEENFVLTRVKILAPAPGVLELTSFALPRRLILETYTSGTREWIGHIPVFKDDRFSIYWRRVP